MNSIIAFLGSHTFLYFAVLMFVALNVPWPVAGPRGIIGVALALLLLVGFIVILAGAGHH